LFVYFIGPSGRDKDSPAAHECIDNRALGGLTRKE
jgi:hypothetical protein